MDRDSNYVVVGAFVLLVATMATSFVYWYTGQREKRTYQRYEIYFKGSVSGLNNGSPVRYLGVDVGKVARIMLDPEQRRTVLVVADIESTAPIDGATLASLSLQGITGLLYVDLERDPKPTGTVLAQGHQYPVIRSAPSDFDVLLTSLPALATRATELMDRVTLILSDDNVGAFKVTLDNARRTSAELPATVRELRSLAADAGRAAREMEGAAAEVRSVARDTRPDIEAALAKVRHVAENMADTSDHLDRFVAQSEPGLSEFTQRGLPQFEQLLRESRAAARDLRDLSRSLKDNPSQLIYESNDRGVELPR